MNLLAAGEKLAPTVEPERGVVSSGTFFRHLFSPLD